MKKALIIVDVQNDFLPKGALHVPEGDQVIPVINNLMQASFDKIIASRDYHPKDHSSFVSQYPQKKLGDEIKLHGSSQILWPTHCVQGTFGSEFAKELDQSKIDHVVLKGTNKDYDSYSTFFDNQHIQSTGLDDYLKKEGINSIYLAGLATDYCVQFSALDALKLGYDVYVIRDGCRGVELHSGDVQKAFARMEKAGAKIIESKTLIDQ